MKIRKKVTATIELESEKEIDRMILMSAVYMTRLMNQESTDAVEFDFCTKLKDGLNYETS